MERRFYGLENDVLFQMDVLHEGKFELGRYFVSKTAILYQLRPEFAYLGNDMIARVKEISYADEKMEMYFKPVFPTVFNVFTSREGYRCFAIKKPRDIYPLECINNYYNGRIPKEHIAWIITRLLNATYLMSSQDLSCNSIILNRCFIGPSQHTVHLYGMFYVNHFGEKTPKLLTSNFKFLDRETANAGISCRKIDIASIKHLGFLLYGFSADTPMGQFFQSQTPENPDMQQILDEWEEVKRETFGPPKFIDMDINESKIYMKGDM